MILLSGTVIWSSTQRRSALDLLQQNRNTMRRVSGMSSKWFWMMLKMSFAGISYSYFDSSSFSSSSLPSSSSLWTGRKYIQKLTGVCDTRMLLIHLKLRISTSTIVTWSSSTLPMIRTSPIKYKNLNKTRVSMLSEKI